MHGDDDDDDDDDNERIYILCITKRPACTHVLIKTENMNTSSAHKVRVLDLRTLPLRPLHSELW